MLSTVLALITCVAIPVERPLDVAAQMSPATPAVEVGTYLTATSFGCRNFSATDYLLVFGRSGSSLTVTVPLPSSASVEYSFSPDALQGVFVEVVALRSPTNIVSSGSIALALPANSSDGSLWFVPAPMGIATWKQTGCEVELVQPSSSLVPGILPDSISEDEEYSAAVQTPIAVPSGRGAAPVAPQSLPPM